MPDYSSARQEIENRRQAEELLKQIRRIFDVARSVSVKFNRYLDGTDPDFNAVMDASYSSAERAELNQMLTPLTTMIEDWETNHFGLLFPDPE
jgi:hypothetical protein